MNRFIEICKGTYPPPFPNPTRGQRGKGANRLMIVTVFQVYDLFEDELASPLWGIAKHARA